MLTQAALLDAFVGGTSLGSLTSLDASRVSSGVITAKTADEDYIDAGATLSAYFAVVNDTGDIYISDIISVDGKDVGSVTLSFKAKASSQLVAKTGSYDGAGWYSAVPEPTSGLLLLLGMAGLALKRKQA